MMLFRRLALSLVTIALVATRVAAANPEGIKRSTGSKSKGTYSKSASQAPAKLKVAPKKATTRSISPSKSPKKKVSSAKKKVSAKKRVAGPDFTKLPVDRPFRVTSEAQIERVRVGRFGERLQFEAVPAFRSIYQGRVSGLSDDREFIQYTLDPDLQSFAADIVAKARSPHVAVVAMEPRTGRVLAVAEKSSTIEHLALHTGFPAASLFKLVTTAAALEQAPIAPESLVNFSGGTYELERHNGFPNPARDTRRMSITEALGRSCNPVFARVALKYLSPGILKQYAQSFGFNSEVRTELPMQPSRAMIPSDDFLLGRTAAGFGEVTLSPIHAAALMSGIANGGAMPRPSFVDRVIDPAGRTVYQFEPVNVRQLMQPDTARTLLTMMTSTTTIGTSRREFTRGTLPAVGGDPVPGKTGTLRGDNPKGLNNWFVGAAPLHRPEIAVAVIVVNPGGASSKASHLGRLLLQRYLTR